ncbi:uncharacterized protein LOC125384268 [Haliotis rufescens]|nr:uncharacterized protein LOC124145416 [Haliotis rufescens]XP_048236507.1 uncharacterized protein LOC125371783 [Haliotis rufescens]XP_048236508.1 uncharacterized protein LOC125371783 [Haliotis rufescens]XP_048236756.1 uncharacterized protein LOC124146389 [Haliotis rufescens]XP_048238081.1 uncharacterized protein LOC125372367 [Haliotis rufescens]XP_048240972.1 uncharacterized protein LOC125374175 [Haliotis rufescens]XP_048246635.1 uncharacterized protein LOC124138808 [Haliotis rufescens]XP_0
MTRVYDFSDGEDDGQDLLRRASSCKKQAAIQAETPRMRQGKSIPYAEFLQLMRVMEGRLHRAITDLKGEVGDLKKEIGNLNSEVRDLKSKLTEKNTQVTALTAKVTRLDNRVQEPTQTSTKSSKVSTNIRAALKAAIDHAETEKGWTMEPMFTLESAQNRQVVKYIWDFSKVIAPSMTKQEFKDGMTRIMLTKKEKLSRTRNGKEKEHTDASRKNSRKLTKSRNRVTGIEKSELPHHTRTKYIRVMKKTQLMSSEESSVDEDGNRVFNVRRRDWESHEMRAAKKVADETFSKTTKTAASIVPRTRRITGVSSFAPPPAWLQKEDSWVSSALTYHGVV